MHSRTDNCMYQQETIKPYNQGEKTQQVEEMFNNIV